MSKEKRSPAEELLLRFTRDLCVCTEEELRRRWRDKRLEAINDILSEAGEPDFEGKATNHNPVYFLAQEVFLDDQRGNPYYLYEPYHRDIVAKNAVEYYLGTSKDRGLLLLGPRETLKSTFFHGAVPMWVLLRHYWLKREYVRVALIHHKDKIAWSNANRLREKFAFHEWMKKIWSECCGSLSQLGSSQKFRLPNVPRGYGSAEFSVEAGGMGGSLTGSHYNAIFFSDLVTEDHRFSSTLRQETQEKHASMKYLLDRVGGKRFYDGTMYHPHDLWNTFLQAKDKNGKCIYRTVIKGAGYDEARELADAGKPHEHVLTVPHKWTLEAMEDDREEFIKTYGTDDFFYAQIENTIKQAKHIITDWNDIRVVDPGDIPRNAINAVLVDPAWKGTENSGKGDYASIQVWSFQRRGNLIIRTLRDGVHSNELSQPDGLAAIFSLGARYGCLYCAAEETGGSGLSKTIEDARSKYGHWFQIVRLRDTFSSQPGKKAARMVNFTGEAHDGQIEVSTECDPTLLEALRFQYVNFTGPGSLRLDDALDCASFTCDSGVREEVVPARGVADTELPFWLRDKTPKLEPTSRYCG